MIVSIIKRSVLEHEVNFTREERTKTARTGLPYRTTPQEAVPVVVSFGCTPAASCFYMHGLLSGVNTNGRRVPVVEARWE